MTKRVLYTRDTVYKITVITMVRTVISIWSPEDGTSGQGPYHGQEYKLPGFGIL